MELTRKEKAEQGERQTDGAKEKRKEEEDTKGRRKYILTRKTQRGKKNKNMKDSPIPQESPD